MSHDCDAFQPPRELLTYAEALSALSDAVRPVEGTETVSLFDASGRILAEDLRACWTVPPTDNSAVDGYAVRSADLAASGACLPVGGRVPAGQVLGRAIVPGEVVRIFTGAPVPDGVDAVIPQENCRVDEGGVWLPLVPSGANIRRRGEDFHDGEVVLPAGRRLQPQDIGLAAAAGHARLTVCRRPRIAYFATGDEVREPGEPLGPGAIVNSNAYIVDALLRRLGCEPRYLGIIRDRFELVRDALAGAAAAGVDAILTTGGVSTGEEDHVKAAVEALGALNFWRIAIRPGRPLAFGRIGAVPFIGLPGNPVAATVTFLMFARPLLRILSGARPRPEAAQWVPADFSVVKKAGRREWLRGSLRAGPDGLFRAVSFPNQGSGVLTSMVASSGLIVLPEELTTVSPGDLVEFLPFSALLEG